MKKLLMASMILVLALAGVAQAMPFTMPGPGQDGNSYLHVGNPPDSPTLWNGEVTALTSNTVSILDVDGPKIIDPVWLVLGIPDVAASYVAPTIKDVSSLGVLVGGPVYAGSLTSGMTLYENIFSIKGDASQSFTNWNLWQNHINGFNAGNYGIFVYEFDMSAGHMVGKNQLDITFNSDLALGTYAVGLGQFIKDGAVRWATTPFTQTGLMTKVPESSVLLLFGSGILALGLFKRKK